MTLPPVPRAPAPLSGIHRQQCEEHAGSVEGAEPRDSVGHRDGSLGSWHVMVQACDPGVGVGAGTAFFTLPQTPAPRVS